MIICVDARPLVEKKVGFGYFLMNMLEEILEQDKENQYYLLSDRRVFFEVEKYSNVKIVTYKDSVICPKSFFYYFRLEKYLKKMGITPDVFWGTEHLMPRGWSKKTKRVLTIHDFTHIRFPKATTKYNLLITKLFFGKSLKNSTDVICISHNSEKELKEYYSKCILGRNVETIYEGGYRKDEIAGLTYNAQKIDEKLIEVTKEKYLLFVGTIEPRKNIPLLIEAAPMLKGFCKVLVCGKIGWESPQVVEKLQNTDNLVYLNYISQEEKAYLMSRAFAQVQPSLYEGFGLPVVESMQSGSIVLVADNSSLAELVQMKELKFETKNTEDFCNKVRALTNQELYSKAKEYCKNRGTEFSWEKAAKEYIRVFNE